LPTSSRWKVKGKVVPDHTKTAHRAITGTDPLTFNISTRQKKFSVLEIALTFKISDEGCNTSDMIDRPRTEVAL
jgi:hypothetical protein